MKEEDKKLILEWCGLKPPDDESGFGFEGRLDMNFYFKYAVPKLLWKIGGTMTLIDFLQKWIYDAYTSGKDPAEAFGEALLKLIKGEVK